MIHNLAAELHYESKRPDPFDGAPLMVPIDIIGWGRGAYAAMRIARRLKEEGVRDLDGTWTKNIPVRFLGLYDPVDMTFYDAPTWSEGRFSQNVISSNVKTAVAIIGKKEGVFGSEVDYDNGSAP